jgi:hypothetical protein
MQRKTLAVVVIMAAVVGAVAVGSSSSAGASENTRGNRGWDAGKTWNSDRYQDTSNRGWDLDKHR